ncbi:hypothetical protein PENSPDRAFT_606122 [Peniophora sp. CONT]|nr:hypothetical protein PENSPDRAFT_606122 [Peniophora sp. CONT]
MAENTPERLYIRPYERDDEKQVRFMVGQAQMEHLAFANNRATIHPVTLAVWIAASAAFAQLMGWWPHGAETVWIDYLRAVPAFFACAVPIMFGFDWLHRPSVESRAERTLRNVDMVDIPAYYDRSPASGFFILQYGEKIIGLVAVDASIDAITNKAIVKDSKFTADESKQLLHGKGTSEVATIRHFFAEEAYHSTGIEGDLLRHAVGCAFKEKAVQTVRISVSPFKRTLLQELIKLGFASGESDGKLGRFGWQWKWYTLSRSRWEKK